MSQILVEIELINFLQSQIKDLSRTRIQVLIREGQVKVNNIIIVSSSKKIKKKIKLKVNFPLQKNIN